MPIYNQLNILDAGGGWHYEIFEKCRMKRSWPQFLISFVLALCLGMTTLAIAGYLNIWKQSWRAEHITKVQKFLPLDIQSNESPRLPKIITTSLFYKEVYPQNHEISIEREKRPIIDSTVIEEDPTLVLQLDVKKPKQFKYFAKKLQKSKLSSVSCPKGKSLFWDSCFGIFEAPWGVTYSGIWLEDKLNGIAKSVDLKTGDTYIGEFANNMFDGCGVFLSKNGSIKSGQWNKNSFIYGSNLCEMQKID